MSGDNAFCLGIVISCGVLLMVALVATRRERVDIMQANLNRARKTEGGSVERTEGLGQLYSDIAKAMLPPDPPKNAYGHKCSKNLFHHSIWQEWVKTVGIDRDDGHLDKIIIYRCRDCGIYYIERAVD